MTDVRSFDRINEFLGPRGSTTDNIQSTLSELTESELAQINEALEWVDLTHDPIGDWRDELKQGHATTMFSELVLLWHFRRELGHENVELNAVIPGSKKDFDLRVKWENREFWIEITKPDFIDQIPNSGGWMPQTRTPNAIDRKLTGEFETAREAVPNAILVLAVYLEAALPQKIMIGKWLNDQHYHPGEFADAFWEFTHPSNVTRVDVRELTEAGMKATELRKELLK